MLYWSMIISSANRRGSLSFMTTVHSSVASTDSNEKAASCPRRGLLSVKPTAQPQIAVKVEHDIIGGQLPTVHRCLVVPVDALPDVEDIGQRVRL